MQVNTLQVYCESISYILHSLVYYVIYPDSRRIYWFYFYFWHNSYEWYSDN